MAFKIFLNAIYIYYFYQAGQRLLTTSNNGTEESSLNGVPPDEGTI